MRSDTRFLIHCIEIYKTAYKISGKEVMKIFTQNGILDYILECYDALHTTGPQYIIEDISSLIAEKQHKEWEVFTHG